MTLLDISNQLVDFFLRNEKFNLDENLASIKVNENYIEHSKQLVTVALDDLVRKDMLVKLNDKVYLLKQPIANFTQSVTISPNIASAIADKCNIMKMGDEGEGEGDTTNPLDISEGDIVKLLIIIDTLLEDTGDFDGEGKE